MSNFTDDTAKHLELNSSFSLAYGGYGGSYGGLGGSGYAAFSGGLSYNSETVEDLVGKTLSSCIIILMLIYIFTTSI